MSPTDAATGTPVLQSTAAVRSDCAEAAILDLVRARGPEKTICPSEAARALAGEADFRPYMEPVREAAERLAREGRIEVTQKGAPVEIGAVHGPIRLRLARRPEAGR